MGNKRNFIKQHAAAIFYTKPVFECVICVVAICIAKGDVPSLSNIINYTLCSLGLLYPVSIIEYCLFRKKTMQ